MVLDKKVVQIGLLIAAAYIIIQIMNNESTAEHMDAVVSIPPEIENEKVSQVTNESELHLINVAPSNALTTTAPVTTVSSPSNALTTTVPILSSNSSVSTEMVPSAITTVEGTPLAEAPPLLSVGEDTGEIFNGDPVDMDQIFGTRGTLNPSELIPKTEDAELYGGLQPDPKLNQNFLQNRWSLGIDTTVGKRNYVNDIRGIPQSSIPPLSIVSPWNQSTQMPDLMRKSLADVS